MKMATMKYLSLSLILSKRIPSRYVNRCPNDETLTILPSLWLAWAVFFRFCSKRFVKRKWPAKTLLFFLYWWKQVILQSETILLEQNNPNGRKHTTVEIRLADLVLVVALQFWHQMKNTIGFKIQPSISTYLARNLHKSCLLRVGSSKSCIFLEDTTQVQQNFLRLRAT